MPFKIKTEHAGAKNGGGFWGRRAEAKAVSRSQRRINDKAEIQAQRSDGITAKDRVPDDPAPAGSGGTEPSGGR